MKTIHFVLMQARVVTLDHRYADILCRITIHSGKKKLLQKKGRMSQYIH